eukprot:scaffold468_cov430-Prasinococcus_capsulatus_cf.AAC.3
MGPPYHFSWLLTLGALHYQELLQREAVSDVRRCVSTLAIAMPGSRSPWKRLGTHTSGCTHAKHVRVTPYMVARGVVPWRLSRSTAQATSTTQRTSRLEVQPPGGVAVSNESKHRMRGRMVVAYPWLCCDRTTLSRCRGT